MLVQFSTTFPPAIRKTLIPVAVKWLPVGGMPNQSPKWVPLRAGHCGRTAAQAPAVQQGGVGYPDARGVAIVARASTRWYWGALVLWALIWGLVILVQINSNSLWQTIVPDRLLGRVQGVISVLSWSAIPLGAFVGGVAIEQTQQVALVYGVIGAAIFLIGLLFSFTALGRAEQYLPAQQPTER